MIQLKLHGKIDEDACARPSCIVPCVKSPGSPETRQAVRHEGAGERPRLVAGGSAGHFPLRLRYPRISPMKLRPIPVSDIEAGSGTEARDGVLNVEAHPMTEPAPPF